VPRFLKSGRVEPRPSVPTLANAMDVGNPSNLERLQWLFDGEVSAMRELISSTAHTDVEVRRTIAELYDAFGYVADPHTAIAFLGGASLFLATAHPAKFREVVEPVIHETVQLPAELAATLTRKKVALRIGPTLQELADLL
jgi:threonine synthase